MLRFLCDQMLAGLGKWLRAAGYDTMIAGDQVADPDILLSAINERRYLLTRDRHFLEMKAPRNIVIYLKGNDIETCIRELNDHLDINWLYRPFSRCLICNTVFEKPDERAISEDIPSDVINKSSHFWFCSKCKKVYWEGSHTERMLKQLRSWQTMEPS